MIYSVLAASGVIFGILLIPTAAEKVDFGLEIPSAKCTMSAACEDIAFKSSYLEEENQ